MPRSATAVTQVERERAVRSFFLSPARLSSASHRVAESDHFRACSPANARLECDPAWGHGHVLGEGQRTPPCSSTSPRLTAGMRTCGDPNSWRYRVAAKVSTPVQAVIDIDTRNIRFLFLPAAFLQKSA